MPRALAAALSGRTAGDVARLADAAAAVHWPVLQGPMEAAVQRGERNAEGDDREAFAIVGEWAGDPDPDNPFARALAVRAAVEWAAAHARAREHLRAAEEDLGDDPVRSAARATTRCLATRATTRSTAATATTASTAATATIR